MRTAPRRFNATAGQRSLLTRSAIKAKPAHLRRSFLRLQRTRKCRGRNSRGCGLTYKNIAAKSTKEYYAELMRLCARLQDGHTNVYPPEQLDVSAKPPIRTGLIQNRVLILEVTSPSLERTGIQPGMEIMRVDGVPALEYGRRYIEPYQSSSTPQDRDFTDVWIRLPSRTGQRACEACFAYRRWASHTGGLQGFLACGFLPFGCRLAS